MVTLERFSLKHLPASMLPLFDIPLWKRLLAGVLYGGLTEELLMRLFLLSLVAWLIGKLWKTPEGRPTVEAFWTAIILVAIGFRVRAPARDVGCDAANSTIVVRALVLNGSRHGVWYLYWKHGLEAAMLGHMSTHL